MANKNPNHPWRKQFQFFKAKSGKPASVEQKSKNVSRGTIEKENSANANS